MLGLLLTTRLIYYQAVKATCLICRASMAVEDELLIWSADEVLAKTPTRACSVCGHSMLFDNEIISVLDYTRNAPPA